MVANLAFLFYLLLPFHFSLGSFGDYDILTIRLLVPLIVLAWLLGVLLKRNFMLPKPLTLFAFTAFLGWATLSLFWAENEAWGLRKILFWLTFFPLFLVLISFFRNAEIRTKALRGVLFGGALVASIGILQFFIQFFIPLPVLSAEIFRSLSFFLGTNFGSAVAEYPSIFVNIGGITFLRAFGFFPDPHIFAYYTGMLLPLAWYWARQQESGRIERVFPYLLLLATLLSFSRASYVALLVAFLVFIAVTFFRRQKNISVPALLLFLGFAALLVMSPVAQRFTSSFSGDGSVTERSRLWQEAVTSIEQAPFLGVGIGNYPLWVKPSAEPREPIYVHNLYLDIAVEIGLVGLLFFLLFLWSCLPKFTLAHSTQEFLPYRLALFLSLVVFLTHSLFEYPLFSVHILPLFLTIMAFLYVEKTSR